MIDNDYFLIGTISSGFELKNKGTKYESYVFHLEVETGSTQNKTNTFLINVNEKCLEALSLDKDINYSGTDVAVKGILKSSIFKDKNGNDSAFVNLDVKELKILKINSKNLNVNKKIETITEKVVEEQPQKVNLDELQDSE